MDKLTKDKIKQINKLNRRMRYEIHHMKHLLFNKHPRSVNGVFRIAHKLVKITTTIKMLSVQIEIIKKTPVPKYPKGGNCSDICVVYENGCEPIINRYGGIQFSKNKPPLLMPIKSFKR